MGLKTKARTTRGITMAHIRKRKSGTFEITIKHQTLPKPIRCSADTEEQALAFVKKTEDQLKTGTLPQEYLIDKPQTHYTIKGFIKEVLHSGHFSASDKPLLTIVSHEIGASHLHSISQKLLSDWIAQMKERQLTPGSIKKRVGALARALDLAVYRGIIPINPPRQLPRNFASYGENDGVIILDDIRTRRLEPGEEERLRKVLEKNPDFYDFFEVALETAMRLSEISTLSWDQIQPNKKTIFLTKTKNGDNRQVPMSSVVKALLERRRKASKNPLNEEGEITGFVFPYFDDNNKIRTSRRISYYWAQVAKKAHTPDLHFHDLRHEATCRLYEKTTFTDIQISLITGHKDPRMLRRYSNLRGSMLALGMW